MALNAVDWLKERERLEARWKRSRTWLAVCILIPIFWLFLPFAIIGSARAARRLQRFQLG